MVVADDKGMIDIRTCWIDALSEQVRLVSGFIMGLQFSEEWLVENLEELEKLGDGQWMWAPSEKGRTDKNGVLEVRGAWLLDRVRVATTQPIPYSFRKIPIVDKVRIQPGDLVLVKNQPRSEQNGVFEIREDYFHFRPRGCEWAEQLAGGAMISVEEGEENGGKTYIYMERRYCGGVLELKFDEVIV